MPKALIALPCFHAPDEEGNNGHCQRKNCTSDAQCDERYRVLGDIYSVLGSYEDMVP